MSAPIPAATLRYAVAPCSLGSVLVAATEGGIRVILLGDDPAALIRDLHAREPAGVPAAVAQLVPLSRGTYRVNLRHGVSRLRSGRRHTMGIIFDDAR